MGLHRPAQGEWTEYDEVKAKQRFDNYHVAGLSQKEPQDSEQQREKEIEEQRELKEKHSELEKKR